MSTQNKKAALEMSMGTIIILVLGVSMLILGMVLVRTVMCGAIGLTDEVNNKVRGELSKLFESSGGEVQCIGAGSTPAKIIAGKTSNVYCSFKTPGDSASYSVSVTSATSSSSSVTPKLLEGNNKWIIQRDYPETIISPSDQEPKKVVRITVPPEAPTAKIFLKLEVKKDKVVLSSYDIDLEIVRQGAISGAIC